MILFDSLGPNPKVVRMFIAERGITGITTEPVDLRGGENRREPYVSKNPTGTLPALQLDDGSYLTEITAICEYLDEVATAGTSLIGATPEERAQTRMWTRRIDLTIVEPLIQGYRFGPALKFFQPRMRCIPQAAEDLSLLAKEKLVWLNGLVEGRTYICGDRFTLADILLFAFMQFGVQIKSPLDPANTNLTAWFDRVAARPSANV